MRYSGTETQAFAGWMANEIEAARADYKEREHLALKWSDATAAGKGGAQ